MTIDCNTFSVNLTTDKKLFLKGIVITLVIKHAAPHQGHRLTSFFLRRRLFDIKLRLELRQNKQQSHRCATNWEEVKRKEKKYRGLGNSKSTLHHMYGTSKQQMYIPRKYFFPHLSLPILVDMEEFSLQHFHFIISEGNKPAPHFPDPI